jgi:hypothetical protein
LDDGLVPLTFSEEYAKRYGVRLVTRETAIALKGKEYVDQLDPHWNVFTVDPATLAEVSIRVSSYNSTRQFFKVLRLSEIFESRFQESALTLPVEW